MWSYNKACAKKWDVQLRLSERVASSEVELSDSSTSGTAFLISNSEPPTKFFFWAMRHLCDLLDVFLFSWCHTNTSGQQLTDTNLELSSAFAGKFEGGADIAAKIWNAIWMSTMHDSDWLAKAFTLSLIGYTLHMRKQLYAILIACIGFFHMWKYSI